MADSRRWRQGSGQVREDDFMRAPGFRDAHESDHLRSGDEAIWHGKGNSSLLLGIAIAAAIAGGAIALFAIALGGPAAAPDPAGPQLAEGDDGDSTPGGISLPSDMPGSNGTAQPSPTLPDLPDIPA